MNTLHAPLEVVQRAATDDDDDVTHMVCHCTGDDRSACGLDVSAVSWRATGGDEGWCPMCALVWPENSPTCPWGCSCDDDCGPWTWDVPA